MIERRNAVEKDTFIRKKRTKEKLVNKPNPEATVV